MPKAHATSKDPIQSVLANIEKTMGNKGKPVISRFKDIQPSPVPVIPFGISEVDEASYCGGVPRGKMVEVFGPESGGKSLLSYYLIASAQKQGLEAALLDVEQAFDPIWAAQHGVDVNNLVWGNDFECGENALEYAYQLCKSKAFGVVVIDSTAALTPKSELEGSLEDNAHIGEQARIMSRGCRKIRSVCGSTNTTCIFINQIRMKIGVMYGNPETTPGGKALKFYSDQRIRVQQKSKIKVREGGEDSIVGQISTVTFVKNKVARPFGRAEFKIIFDTNSMNPVVMLCNTARSEKLIKPYKGVFNIAKGVLGGDAIKTGAVDMIDLSNYLIDNNLVIPLIDRLMEDTDKLDDAILEMKSNPSSIIRPSRKNSTEIDAKKINDASAEEIGEDAIEEVIDEEE